MGVAIREERDGKFLYQNLPLSSKYAPFPASVSVPKIQNPTTKMINEGLTTNTLNATVIDSAELVIAMKKVCFCPVSKYYVISACTYNF